MNVSIVRRERAQAQVLSPSKAAMKSETKPAMCNLKAKKKRSNEARRVHKNRNRQVHRTKNASASAGSAPRPHPSRTLQEQRTSARCRKASPGPGKVLCRACHDLRSHTPSVVWKFFSKQPKLFLTLRKNCHQSSDHEECLEFQLLVFQLFRSQFVDEDEAVGISPRDT